MKYVVGLIDGANVGVMFNDCISHSEVAHGLAGFKVTGAGFCDTQGNVWGESDTLNIKSNPIDAHVLLIAQHNFICPKP